MKKNFSVLDWTKSNEGIVVKGSIASLAATLGMFEPVIGVCTAFAMELYDPLKRKIFVSEITKVSEEFEKLQDSLDFEFIQSDKGMKILSDVLKEIINETEEVRRKYLRSFLVSTYTKQDMERVRTEDYLDTLISSKPVDLQILKTVYQPREIVKQILERILEPGITRTHNLKDQIGQTLKIDPDVYERALKRLSDNEVIVNIQNNPGWSNARYSKEDSQVALNTTTLDVQNRVTRFGKDFIKFCKLGDN